MGEPSRWANKYPLRNHPCKAWSGWVPWELEQELSKPHVGTLGCVTVIYQGWSRPRWLCSPDMAKPQSHACFWESQTLVSSEITRNHHIISCATAENVGSSLKLSVWMDKEQVLFLRQLCFVELPALAPQSCSPQKLPWNTCKSLVFTANQAFLHF